MYCVKSSLINLCQSMPSFPGEKILRKRGGSYVRKPILLKVEKIMNSKRCCNMFQTCRDDSSYKLLCPSISFAQSFSSYFTQYTHVFEEAKNGLLNYLLCFHRRHRRVSFNNYSYPSCLVE